MGLRISRRLLILILVLAAVGLSSSAVAVQYQRITGSINVLEPITITPPVIAFSAFPNQEVKFNITITNRAPGTINLSVNASVIDFPAGGSRDDIQFILPTPFKAFNGTNLATITAEVRNGALPGTYRIAVSFSRVN